MITFSKFGQMGNLGNQLFQYASMIGLALKHEHSNKMPDWKYSKYFTAIPVIARNEAISKQIKEPNFHFSPEFFEEHLSTKESKDETIDISGWLQSEKYWDHYTTGIKNIFKFKDDFVSEVLKKSAIVNLKSAIAISIRRGDYVNNPNYYQLPITYYLHALYKFFPDWQQRTVIIFSDDIPYCKTHFAAAENVVYADGLSDIEQLCLMSGCKDHIISNSTFSWWGAYLGESCSGKVIRPAHHFAGKLLETSDWKDYYPDRWYEFDHEEEKFDLSNVTFTIPVAFDHLHRKQNLELNICMLQRDFNTNIIIGEQGANPKFAYMQTHCRYRHFFGMAEFHRTKMLNEMARMSNTEIIVNWDADVFLPPLNILLAVEALTHDSPLTTHVVYPYDGRFARVERTWFKPLEKMLDLGIFQNKVFTGMKEADARSVGGAVFFNKKAFIEGGMENEHMVSYGPEDRERLYRFQTLGFLIKRIPGAIYHLDHWRGPNSSAANVHFKKNTDLYNKMKAMTSFQLTDYVKSWPWLQTSLRGTKQSNGIDVVIPLGKGSTWQNNELRYCLRSIEKHLKGYGRIYIVGDLPAFLTHHSPLTTHDIIHLSIPDESPHNPAKNIYNKLMAACYDQQLSMEFIYFNDDYILTQDIDAATLPHYHKEHDLKESAGRIQQGNTFRQALENTAKALEAKSFAVKNFDVHIPMRMNKENFLKLQQYDWRVPYGYTAKSLYANSNGIEGEFMCDCKISQGLSTEEINSRVSDRFVFSYGDAGLFGDMKQWLKDHFPQPSTFENPVPQTA
jgi:hypothetical protein